MGIVYKQGDILASGADAIVIPVNCKGTWGAGISRMTVSICSSSSRPSTPTIPASADRS